MSEPDIVARLRRYKRLEFYPPICGEAADEIERLRACVSEANAYMAEAALAIERLHERIAELEERPSGEESQ